MSRTRVYLPSLDKEKYLEISQREIIHKIKNVLRLKVQDAIYIFNGQGKEGKFKILEISSEQIYLKREGEILYREKPQFKISLCFPLMHQEKVKFILQKATELGVMRFIPFICERSLQKFPLSDKLLKWKKIIIEAVRQSERFWLPEIVSDFKILEFLKNIDSGLKFFADRQGEILKKDRDIQEVVLVTGPEGGFTQKEKSFLRENNFIPLKLSPYNLRAETANIAAVTLLNYLWQ